MKKMFYLFIFLAVLSFNSFSQFTCDYEMTAVNNSSHGCNNGGINTTLPSNIYPSLAHDVYYNGSFITTVSLSPFAGTTFFSTVFFDGHGLGTWEYYAHYLDENGVLVNCNYHQVIVTEPPCNLTIVGFTATNSTVCSSGQVSGTVSGNFCGQWTNTLYSGSINGPVVYSNTGSSAPSPYSVSNLPTGVYYARITDGSCTSEYNTTVNSCPKPSSGFTTTNITSSQAKVKWDIVPCALNYQVHYRPAGATTWIKKSTTSNTGVKILKGLLASTNYEWEVRSKCYDAPAIWSSWSAKNTFSTLPQRTGAGDAIDPKEIVLNLYPNPSHDQLEVLFESNAVTAEIKIISMNGQVVWSKYVTVPDRSFHQSVNVSQLSAGLYLLQVSTKNGLQSAPFTKE